MTGFVKLLNLLHPDPDNKPVDNSPSNMS